MTIQAKILLAKEFTPAAITVGVTTLSDLSAFEIGLRCSLIIVTIAYYIFKIRKIRKSNGND